MQMGACKKKSLQNIHIYIDQYIFIYVVIVVVVFPFLLSGIAI